MTLHVKSHLTPIGQGLTIQTVSNLVFQNPKYALDLFNEVMKANEFTPTGQGLTIHTLCNLGFQIQNKVLKISFYTCKIVIKSYSKFRVH